MPTPGSRRPDGPGTPSAHTFSTHARAHLNLDALLTRLLADEEIGFSYDEREKRLVWSRGETIPGLDPAIYRKCPRTGAILCYGHIGHAHLRSGWDYGYVYPPEHGGLDLLSNMRPEQCEEYRPAQAGRR
jgi:hypothetical protein